MKQLVSAVLILVILFIQVAFATVIQEIPENAISIDNGMYIVGENVPSGSYTFCIDLNAPEVAEQIRINKEAELARNEDNDRYYREHKRIKASLVLYKDYKTMLDDITKGQYFEASDTLSLHIVLVDGMAITLNTLIASKAYLIPD